VIVEGAFVKTLFPTDEYPRWPGLLHICYCLGVARPIVLVACTSSQPWPARTPLPAGVRVFDRSAAAALRRRPFVLILNRIAKLPLTVSWFPAIETMGQGIVAVAPAALRDEKPRAATELTRRHGELMRRRRP
jgi:hypothetical protein